MNQTQPLLLSRMGALIDPLRCRMLLLLEAHELTVSELCRVLQLPQSTVSRHLKLLSQADWVTSRRDGTSHFYRLAVHGQAEAAPQMWRLVRQSMLQTPGVAQDRLRLEGVLDRRRSKSQQFFASAAHQWDQLRRELFGPDFSSHSLLALLDPDWIVGDLGCGTGQLTASLAPFVKQVIAVDESSDMLGAARGRLESLPNVQIRQGTLERLPIADEQLDVAVLMLVLHHLPHPAAAFAEAARALRPGGRLLMVDMYPHDREEYRQQMGHLWLGFSPQTITDDLVQAGFETVTFHPLPPGGTAKGPALFAATARRGTITAGRSTESDPGPAHIQRYRKKETK